MNYSQLVDLYIRNSGMSLAEITMRMNEEKGVKVDRSYISKLRNDPKYPASEEINRALAEVTGGDANQLILASFYERSPQSVKNLFDSVSDIGELITKIFVKSHDEERTNFMVELLKNEVSKFHGSEEDKRILLDYLNNGKNATRIMELAPLPLKLSILEKLTQVIQDTPIDDFIELTKDNSSFVRESSEEYFHEPKVAVLKSIKPDFQFNNYDTDDTHSYIPIEMRILRGRKVVCFVNQNNDMEGDGIFKNDIVVISVQEHVEPNDIAVVIVEEEIGKLRKVKIQDNLCILTASKIGIEPEIIPRKSVRIIGKVVQSFRDFA